MQKSPVKLNPFERERLRDHGASWLTWMDFTLLCETKQNKTVMIMAEFTYHCFVNCLFFFFLILMSHCNFFSSIDIQEQDQ